ncbi:MAG: T9SS C-terminal target domain-containing protein [Ignavibacteriae bacterium]|nr:MAG: T9SS C-terminal target domain-containing protein [Ignavibacteriota bacterium]
MKSRYLILILFSVISTGVLQSQVSLEWVKYNSGEQGSTTINQRIRANSFGNTYITGSYSISSQSNGFALSYNPEGSEITTVWTGNLMQPTCNWIDKLFYTYVGGYYNIGQERYLDIAKLSPQGIEWEVKDSVYGWGAYEVIDITSDNSGNTYVLRFKGIYSIYKYNQKGECSQFPLTGIIDAYKIAVDPSNDDILLVCSKVEGAYVIRYDSYFMVKWQKPIAIFGNIIKFFCAPSGIVCTLDDAGGSYIIKQGSVLYCTYPGTPSDMVIDYNGDAIFTGKSVTQKTNDYNYCYWTDSSKGNIICIDRANNVYTANNENGKIIISKMNWLTGDKLWTYEYDPPGIDSACSITTDSFYNVYICGISNQNSTGRGFVLKLKQVLRSISGTVRYNDNEPASDGVVFAYAYINKVNRLIKVDSSLINANGQFIIPFCPVDSLYLLTYKKNLFVPTYYISTINWQNAALVYPVNNLYNIDINTFKIEKIGNTTGNTRLFGLIYGQLSSGNYDILEDAIVYLEKDNKYQSFYVAYNRFNYILDSLTAGQYILKAYRIGYYPVTQLVNIIDNSATRFDIYFNRILSVSNETSIFPKSFKLKQNYPNPFNPVTTISLDIPKSSDVKIVIYDITGKVITELVNEHMSPGTYTKQWDASNYSSGVYFYQLITHDFIESKKMVLIK